MGWILLLGYHKNRSVVVILPTANVATAYIASDSYVFSIFRLLRSLQLGLPFISSPDGIARSGEWIGSGVTIREIPQIHANLERETTQVLMFLKPVFAWVGNNDQTWIPSHLGVHFLNVNGESIKKLFSFHS